MGTPQVLKSNTYKLELGCGSCSIILCYSNEGEELRQVIVAMGKGGTCRSLIAQATGRMITALLRAGKTPEYIKGKLIGLECPEVVHYEGNKYTSCFDYVGRILTLAYKPIRGEPSP